MKDDKTRSIVKYIAFIVACLAVCFTIQLFQNIAAGPLTFNRAFSKENIKETFFLLIIAAVIVLPFRLLYVRLTESKKK